METICNDCLLHSQMMMMAIYFDKLARLYNSGCQIPPPTPLSDTKPSVEMHLKITVTVHNS